MPRLLFQQADRERGEFEIDVPEDLEWMREAVFERGDEFWDGMDGSAGIYYWEVETSEHLDPQSDSYIEPVSSLNIIAREEFGFIVFYKTAGIGSIVLTTGMTSDDIVEPLVGGQEYELF